MVVGQYSVLDLTLFPYALGLCPIFLEICLAGIRHLPAEDGQSFDSINQINGKELVIDRGLATLIPL